MWPKDYAVSLKVKGVNDPMRTHFSHEHSEQPMPRPVPTGLPAALCREPGTGRTQKRPIPMKREVAPESNPGVTPAQLKAWKAMRCLLENRSDADRRYDLLPDFWSGRIISTDLARFLDERYARPPKRGLRNIEPGWDLPWRNGERIIFAICVHEIEFWLLPLWDTARAAKCEGCTNAVDHALAKAGRPSLNKDPRRYGGCFQRLRQTQGTPREGHQKSKSESLPRRTGAQANCVGRGVTLLKMRTEPKPGKTEIYAFHPRRTTP